MSDPKHHHHVAQFYLKGWCRDDGKLCVFERKGPQRRLVHDWHTPKHVGYEPYLYTIPSLTDDPQWVETQVMQRQVDDPASKAMQVIVAKGLGSLTGEQRTAWCRFLIAQWYRSPEKISKLLRVAEDSMLTEFTRSPEQYEFVRTELDPATLLELKEQNWPGLDRAVALRGVLPDLINDQRATKIIGGMHWAVYDLSASKLDLLTSDRPVVRYGGLDSPDCMIAVPLNPKRLFFALDRRYSIRYEKAEQLVRVINTDLVTSAREAVYSTGTQHAPLIGKYFGVTPVTD